MTIFKSPVVLIGSLNRADVDSLRFLQLRYASLASSSLVVFGASDSHKVILGASSTQFQHRLSPSIVVFL